MDIKAEIYQKIQDRAGDFNVGIDNVKKLGSSLLQDCKDILEQLPELSDFVGVLIDIADDKTNSGIFDAIDAPLAKYAFGKLKQPSWDVWYKAERQAILDAKGLADGQTPAGV